MKKYEFEKCGEEVIVTFIEDCIYISGCPEDLSDAISNDLIYNDQHFQMHGVDDKFCITTPVFCTQTIQERVIAVCQRWADEQ